jgi:hypothetical protein
LAFPTRKFDSLLTDRGFVRLGKPLDEIVGIGCFCGFDDLFFRAFDIAIGDVISNGIIKEDGLLGD